MAPTAGPGTLDPDPKAEPLVRRQSAPMLQTGPAPAESEGVPVLGERRFSLPQRIARPVTQDPATRKFSSPEGLPGGPATPELGQTDTADAKALAESVIDMIQKVLYCCDTCTAARHAVEGVTNIAGSQLATQWCATWLQSGFQNMSKIA